ncbi:ParA family protein [Vibrio sp. S9_S30]|uniref:ParA family protein n=1 Tax=Vibrio sp. S9_S30 TaxID=2720226 RepID=UPI00168086C5|nr:ParA family protein [Vibrio sp. S9_S30]MBD1559525.1 ParA family protein [Vibrio sp. S9_S30]
MTEIEQLAAVAENMKKEQISRRDLIATQTSINVSDEEVEGMNRLFYNHCLNKKALRTFAGMAPATFQKNIDEAIATGVISEPIYQNKQHLFTRFHIEKLMEYWGKPKYRDNYKPRVISVQNQKGGTGKSTTAETIATASALDLQLNAKVCLIDMDPQGTLGQSKIANADNDAIYLTIIDMILGDIEPDGEFQSLIKSGMTEKEVIQKAAFNTHLPNLDVYPAFSTDERFIDLFWQQKDDSAKQALITRLANKIIPTLQEVYDIIIIDTPPQESPLIWAANEALDCLLAPLSPRAYDFDATTNYMLTNTARMMSLPSKGKNLLWGRLLVVNHDENSRTEREQIEKLSKSVQNKLLSTYLIHSELIVAASDLKRTALDVAKSEKLVSPQKHKEAMTSISSVYNQIIREIKAISVKEETDHV